jgi:hypothetical protein
MDQDEPAAVVISAYELEDVEDALAVAEARLREASGDCRRILTGRYGAASVSSGDLRGGLGAGSGGRRGRTRVRHDVMARFTPLWLRTILRRR